MTSNKFKTKRYQRKENIQSSHGLNKGHGSKIHVGSWVQQEIPEEGLRTYRPKHCVYNNQDEDNSLKTLNDNNPELSLPLIQNAPVLFMIGGTLIITVTIVGN